MARILGIDPGSRITGYGVVEVGRNHNTYIASGHLRIDGDSVAERLHMIYERVHQVVEEFQPEEMAIESVFMHRNAGSALKLGQARGVAICACARNAIPVSEYSPREVKQAVVGRGAAAKDQVQHMVRVLLNLAENPQEDEADALAVAICHGHARQTLARIPEARRARAGRLR